MRPKPDAEVVESKLEAVGYGLLVPVFFINTGVEFDLEALVADGRTIAMLPLVRRAAARRARACRHCSRRPRVEPADSRATALFGATGLPIIVAVTAIGVDREELDDRNGGGARRRRHALGAALPAHRTRHPRHRRAIAAAPTSTDDVDIPTEG